MYKMNIFPKLLMLLCISLVMFTACEDDELQINENPEITISTTRSSLAAVDLDQGTGPNIVGWAVAPAGLSQVTITVETTNGTEDILNVTSFDEENSEKGGTAYHFNVLPHYTPDFISITATAIDVKNRMDTVVWVVSATGGTKGPTITSIATDPIEANIRPSVDVRPTITGGISTHWGLKSVRFVQVYENSEEVLQEVTDFGDTPNQYAVNITPDYDKGYDEGMTGFRIEAVDNRDNVSEVTIPVTVIDASPAPRISFDMENLEADLTANPQVRPTVTGTVNAPEGLSAVRYYLVRATGDVPFGTEVTSFDDPNRFDFSIDPDYSLGVIGVKVEAVDILNQTTSEMVEVKVIADDPDLSVYRNVVLHSTANRHDPGVHTAFSTRDGTPYTLYDGLEDPEVAATIDFVVADSGGNNELDLFSPDHNWLVGNYYEDEAPGDLLWDVVNETRMRQLSPGEIDFESATSIDIAALDLGGEWETRVDPLFPGDMVLFVTSEGKKGILNYVSTNDDPGKADIYTFDVKVLK